MSDKCGQPVLMKNGAPKSFTAEEAAVQKLADKLRKKASPLTTMDDFQTLCTYIDDELTRNKVAHVFLRAGGLTTLIGHLGGTSWVAMPSPSAHPDITASALPNASAVLDNLLEPEDSLEDAATLPHPPLNNELRNARLTCRGLAAYALGWLAIAQPVQMKAMAEAGVIGRLLELYIDIGDLPLESLAPGTSAAWFSKMLAQLARLLLESETVAAQDLNQAICGPSPVQTFGAIALLQVCMTFAGTLDLVSTLVDAGVVNALVATLAHESPYCVAAAAAVLGLIGHTPGKGKAAIEASGTVAALVHIMKISPSPGDPTTETGLFRWTVLKFTIQGEADRLHFRNPTAVAVAGLLATAPYSGPMLDSFIKAGGVPALLRVFGESNCPLTMRYSLAVINTLLGKLHTPETRSRSRELADELFHSGLCRAALRALESGSKAVRQHTLDVLATFFKRLSKNFHPAAIAALVAGNAVEAALQQMDEEGADMELTAMALLMLFMAEPAGKMKMYALGLVAELEDGTEVVVLKDRRGHLRSQMHGAGGNRADSPPPQSGATAPACTGDLTGPGGASPSCRAASRMSTCSRCGASAADMLKKGKLKVCTGCRSVRYCGKACQMADWPAHKAMCKRLQAASK